MSDMLVCCEGDRRRTGSSWRQKQKTRTDILRRIVVASGEFVIGVKDER